MVGPRARKWDLLRLPAAERVALLRRTHALQAQLFHTDESFEDYCQWMARTTPSERFVWTFEDAAGALVGYNFVSFYRLVREGRPLEVLRSNAGLLPAYRRHNRIIGAGLVPCLLQRVLWPSVPMYFHAWLAHPSGYCSLAPYLAELYPSARNEPAPREVEALVRFLNDAFEARTPDPGDPWIVDVGMRVREDAAGAARWRESTRPEARYFLRKNPDYAAGHSLTVLVPVTLGTLGSVAARLVVARIDKALRPPARDRP